MAIGSKELAPVELDTFEDERLVDELKKSSSTCASRPRPASWRATAACAP